MKPLRVILAGFILATLPFLALAQDAEKEALKSFKILPMRHVIA